MMKICKVKCVHLALQEFIIEVKKKKQKLYSLPFPTRQFLKSLTVLFDL